MYRTLEIDETVSTLQTLRNRIQERFPNAGLKKVCEELVTIAGETRGKISRMAQPNVGVRLGIATVFVLCAIAAWMGVRFVRVQRDTYEFAEFVQLVEAATNVIVLAGAALFSLATLETRWKRARALKALHELRSVAHVIDMHQLTKDPSQILMGSAHPTASSPKRTLTPFLLMRYLDYCSEMLALIGKLAALYPQTIQDRVVLQSVNDIEVLTNGLSRKIWQKIMILEEELRRAGDQTSFIPRPDQINVPEAPPIQPQAEESPPKTESTD